jgi:hypothetical protein
MTYANENEDFQDALVLYIHQIDQDDLDKAIGAFIGDRSDKGAIHFNEYEKALRISSKTVDETGEPIKKSEKYVCIKNQMDYVGGRSSLSGYYDVALVKNLNNPLIDYNMKRCEKDQLVVFSICGYKRLLLKASRAQNQDVFNINLIMDGKLYETSLKINEEKSFESPWRIANLEKYRQYFGFKGQNLPKEMAVKSKLVIKNCGYYRIIPAGY